MSEELRECPHCGATRGLYTLDEYGGLCADDDLITQIFCDNCKSAFENERANNGRELIEAWNIRAEHTCTFETVVFEDSAFTHNVLECSNCGLHIEPEISGRMPSFVNYCPHCGVRVIV